MLNLIETERREVKSSLVVNNDLDAICFPVVQRDMWYTKDGEPIKTDYKALVNPDTNQLLYIGNNYTPIYNEMIKTTVKSMEGFQISDIRSYDNKTFEINLINPDVVFPVGKQDANLRIKIVNSYDGSRAFQIQAGAFIQICSNGATIGEKIDFKRKHIGSSGDIYDKLFELNTDKIFNQVRNRLEQKNWNRNSDEEVKDIFKQLTKHMPDGLDGTPNKAKLLLQDKFDYESAQYEPEFALYMAATNMATFGHKYGLAWSYQKDLDNIINFAFFGKN